MHKAFHTVFQLNKHAKGSNAGYYAVIFFADMPAMYSAFFKSTVARSASAAVRSRIDECSAIWSSLLIYSSFVFSFIVRVSQPFMQQAVYNQSG